jgi:hypothetical protein
MFVRELLERLKRLGHPGLAKEYLKELTKHHRIQGSRGLIDAVKAVKEIVEGYELETRIIEIPPDSERGFIETPVSWDVERGFLEIKRESSVIARFDSLDHPTLIAAHSPPGEGCSELVYCSDLSECSGRSVLLEAPAYIAFRELDADVVVLYDTKRHPEAVPYTGLFLRSSEIKKKPAVFNIPASLALKIVSDLQKGVKIEICWSCSSKYLERPHYALLAYRGSEPGVLYISHICHPKPGGHDNASGSVANILTAYMLSQLREISHIHAWVPEYTGTVFLKEHLSSRFISVINLDMVGSKQWVTDSTLNIVMAPLYVEQKASAYTFLASKLVLDEAQSFGGFKLPRYRYSISPYSAGSDHDVTIAWGFDSVMLNEWPSKYYHTDMDDVDSLSPTSLVNTSIIASLAGLLLNKRYSEESVLKTFKEHLKSWYALEALKHQLDASELNRLLESSIKPENMNTLTSPLSMKYLYRVFGREVYMKLREIKGSYSFFTLYGPLAYINGIKDPLAMFQLENLIALSSEDKKLIVDVWSRVRKEIVK